MAKTKKPEVRRVQARVYCSVCGMRTINLILNGNYKCNDEIKNSSCNDTNCEGILKFESFYK